LKNGDSQSQGASYVLDSSALLTLIEDEPGADRVEQLLRKHAVLLPFVVLLEIFYISLQEQSEEKANARYAMLKALDVTFLNEVTEPVLLRAAQMKAYTRVSLADSLIAAFAAEKGAVLVHKDPEFAALKDQLRLEALPYKAQKR
jgi:predicted nucleic acid-binding protein